LSMAHLSSRPLISIHIGVPRVGELGANPYGIDHGPGFRTFLPTFV
jgi:hypothetical protein